MLQQLRIRNYAIIDEISIDFSGKLNVITGETGAGKSILAGALALILGERADSGVLLKRDKKCVVEAVFAVNRQQAVRLFLEENDLDTEEELFIRREIGTNGKSRAFINDTPVNLEQLRQLGALLVDLHQQFDTLELGESAFQREVLDALAGQIADVNTYHAIYQQWINAEKKLQVLRQQQSETDKESGYYTFLFNELEEARFIPNELEDIEQELKLLSNAEGIKNALSKVYYDLQEAEEPVVQQLKTSIQQVQAFATYHPELPSIVERLQSVQIEVRDIAGDIEHVNQKVQYDPQRIEQINQRLSTGYALLKKHGVRTTAELLNKKDELESRLKTVLNIADRIHDMEKETAKWEQQARQQASGISSKRQAQTGKLEQQVNQLLRKVGMPNARLRVELAQGALNPFGMDDVEFLFDANKSNRFEPIRKVASGGELSRLMLCIKSLVAESIDLPTSFFDEIDSGISGEAAKQVGIILKELSAKRQVICITHQPQIAGKADAHYFVYKDIDGEMIQTHIRLLTDDERIMTIARMLSGEKPTAAALENAREMVMD